MQYILLTIVLYVIIIYILGYFNKDGHIVLAIERYRRKNYLLGFFWMFLLWVMILPILVGEYCYKLVIKLFK